jgi:hypothetical protein
VDLARRGSGGQDRPAPVAGDGAEAQLLPWREA